MDTSNDVIVDISKITLHAFYKILQSIFQAFEYFIKVPIIKVM